MGEFSLALHGGAGTITRSLMTAEKENAYTSGLADALEAGRNILAAGGSALDAVEKVVCILEDNPLFNAGKGAVFTHDGSHEMDACIMRGDSLAAGAVAGVHSVRNPVSLARAVMEKSEHVLLAGAGAEAFANACGMKSEPPEYFFSEFRYNQFQQALRDDVVQLDHTERKFGTVGAVARDIHGMLAAATSTGGMTNKRWGRIGDSPIVGAGNYANNESCAVSCTGHGEYFIRAVVAYDLACLIQYKGLTLQEACRVLVHDKLVKFGGEGGLVAVDANGNIEMPFNSEGMYRACIRSGEEAIVRIYRE
jgi:beta-aspartyl-peptidase (threonine type)